MINVGGNDYLSAEEIAEQLGVPRYRVVRLIRTNAIMGRKIGRQYLVSPEEFDKWVRNQSTPAAAAATEPQLA